MAKKTANSKTQTKQPEQVNNQVPAAEPAKPEFHPGLSEEDIDPQPEAKKAQEPFEEWKCEIRVQADPRDPKGKAVIRTYEKLKIVRKSVKITKGEADTINAGRIGGADSGTIVTLYLAPVKEAENETEE